MPEALHARTQPPRRKTTRLQLGFLGVGWIGFGRMNAIAAADIADIVAVGDADDEAIARARALAPEARAVHELDELFQLKLDGVVIATPSALHAEQAIRSLQAGCAVFCQKPLARTAEETRRVVDAARRADLLLGVDLSYRLTTAYRSVLDQIRFGALGDVYAVDLTFHNAYGPDKPWFRDAARSGGGCVIDLGIHLVDLALLALDWPNIVDVQAHLYTQGRLLPKAPAEVEDYATAMMLTDRGQSVRLTCSWNLNAGQDAVISAVFHGNKGAAGLFNVNGSFYDFQATLDRGTRREVLCSPPDDWGGRSAIAWATQLSTDPGFDVAAERLVDVAAVIDRVYGR